MDKCLVWTVRRQWVDTGSTKNKELGVSPKISTTASLRGNASDTKSNGNLTRLCGIDESGFAP